MTDTDPGGDGSGSAVGNAFREFFVDERFGAERGDPAERDRVTLLRQHREQLKQRRQKLIRGRGASFLAASGILIFVPVLAIATEQWQLAAIVAAYGLMALLANVSARQRVRETGDEILEIDNEIDLLTIDDDSPERRAQKLFQLNALDLKRYYDQTLHQGTYIFWVGVGCILLGFGVVTFTVLRLTNLDGKPLSQQIVIGVLGATGAVLADFVAVIYLRMYSETVKSMTEFHHRLVGTHHLHFGNVLVAKIADSTEREQTLRTMAESLVGEQQQRPNGGSGGGSN